MKSARRRAREFAVQGLYAWQLSRAPGDEILANLADSRDFDRADRKFLNRLLVGAIESETSLRDSLQPALDRPWVELSPVERALLLMATYELVEFPDVPYRVVINEAVEIAKLFGGTDGHKYVNGVLDRVSRSLRPAETA